MSPLEKDLESEMLRLYEKWKAFGRPKNYFLQMVKKTKNTRVYKGPAGTIRHLLGRSTDSAGFVDLLRSGHVDLTVENLILQPKWKPLFPTDWDDLCKIARARVNSSN